jgi:hypothetical protein
VTNDNLCVRCGRPMADQAYACSSCAYRAGDQLHAIVDITPAARDIAHGFARRGRGSGGSTEPRLLLNLGATQRLDSVQGSLTTWVRHVMAERGILGPGIAGDPLVAAARWLAGHVEWWRHRREVDEFLADVEACARVVSGLARGAGEKKFLGPCGAVLAATATPCPDECSCRPETHTAQRAACAACLCFTGCHAEVATDAEGRFCVGDVYGYHGAKTGRCKACGHEVATGEREAWLNGEVRDHAFRAAEIAAAYGVNVNTIRTWASRPRPDTGEPPLRSYYRTDGGIVANWAEPSEGEDRERLHYVGDVLDLAAADAARRATEQAKRARRAATRAATTEGDAA